MAKLAEGEQEEENRPAISLAARDTLDRIMEEVERMGLQRVKVLLPLILRNVEGHELAALFSQKRNTIMKRFYRGMRKGGACSKYFVAFRSCKLHCISAIMTRLMPSEESPEARFDRLKRQLQDSILRDYPNPQRTGCSGRSGSAPPSRDTTRSFHRRRSALGTHHALFRVLWGNFSPSTTHSARA